MSERIIICIIFFILSIFGFEKKISLIEIEIFSFSLGGFFLSLSEIFKKDRKIYKFFYYGFKTLSWFFLIGFSIILRCSPKDSFIYILFLEIDLNAVLLLSIGVTILGSILSEVEDRNKIEEARVKGKKEGYQLGLEDAVNSLKKEGGK